MPVHPLGTMVGSVFQDPRSQFLPLIRPTKLRWAWRIFHSSACDAGTGKGSMRTDEHYRLLDRRIFPLSSGEKQLIAIASICAMEPK